MDGKPTLWVSWGILLLSLASVAYGQGCRQIYPFIKGEVKCDAGEELIYEIRHRTGEGSGRCCPPGDSLSENIRAEGKGCRSTKCLAPGIKDPCSTDIGPDYIFKGKKMVYEESKRESCTDKKGSPGEATYCCPVDSLERSLASALAAEQNEFPYMAKVEIVNECGGTIYNKRYILTASHCVVDDFREHVPIDPSFKVTLGRNVHKTPQPENDYSVKRTVSYPKYTGLEPNVETAIPHHDIALVELDRDITFGPNVKAIQFAPKGFDEMKYSGSVVAVGWGVTNTGFGIGNLQKANFLIRNDDSCFSRESLYHDLSNLTETVLCLGGYMEGVWSPVAGRGDSGGPAICRGPDGNPLLCGVAAAAGDVKKCIDKIAGGCQPNIYTETDEFMDWIEKEAGKQDPSTFFKAQLYGEVVKASEAEHQVRITSASGKPCGGTLIAPDTVVTAAHCIADAGGNTLPGLKVWSGVKDISGSQGNSHGVKAIATLDDFKRVGAEVNVETQKGVILETDNYYKNNLGVIKLSEPAKISPASLPKLPGTAGAPGPAVEFAFPRNTTYGGELRKREFTILDKKDCQLRFDHLDNMKMDRKLDDNLMCGAETYSGGSICDRELGGGLICKNGKGQDELCGVQVQRYCKWTIPNGFIDVGMVSPWVQAAMEQL